LRESVKQILIDAKWLLAFVHYDPIVFIEFRLLGQFILCDPVGFMDTRLFGQFVFKHIMI
jgi:hypothetical protein